MNEARVAGKRSLHITERVKTTKGTIPPCRIVPFANSFFNDYLKSIGRNSNAFFIDTEN